MYLLMLLVILPWLVKASALCSDYMFDLGEYRPTTLYITPTGEALCSIVVSQKSSNKICLKTELETATIPSLTSRLTCWIPDCSFVERTGGESMQLFANGADPSNWKRGLSSEMCTLELKLFLHWVQSHFELACAYDLHMPVMFLRV